MSDIAVRIRDVGKLYRIGMRRGASQVMLREVVSNVASAPFRALRAAARGTLLRADRPVTAVPAPDSSTHIWALRHVSFDVRRGEIVGIIGPNGAGKSTLLKILSRITDPTEGRIEISGRVGSLLEVGTGFHPELTGRENIYLSGALLGMRKAEIERNLDAIVAFAEVDKFIDTQVKHYSSGMYVRLAFSVAAHLEPEVLIVDEVLAVGDVAFQRKCLNKMEDVRQHGRTILFVSHNMQAVTRLCDRAVLISRGVVQEDGPASHVSAKYLLSSLRTSGERNWTDLASSPGNDVVRLRSVRVRDESGATTESVDIRKAVGIELVYDVLKDGHMLVPSCQFDNEAGTCVFCTLDLEPKWRERTRPRGRFTSVVWVPGNFFAEGAVLVTPAISTHRPNFKVHLQQRDAVAFHVQDSFEGDSARGDWDGSFSGVVRPLLTWSSEYLPADILPRE